MPSLGSFYMILAMQEETRQPDRLQMRIIPEDIAVSLPSLTEKLDLSALFRQPGPVDIEIGSGKGTFLLNQARKHPEINYLGIEYANPFYKFSLDRITRWQMTNVRLLHMDAKDFLRFCMSDNSVRAYHIYFPDPWPKRRQKRRRFFQPANILEVYRTLIPGGELRAATDHEEYYQWMTALLLQDSQMATLFEPIPFFAADAAGEGEWVGSNFERKYRKEGRSVYTFAVRKRLVPGVFS